MRRGDPLTHLARMGVVWRVRGGLRPNETKRNTTRGARRMAPTDCAATPARSSSACSSNPYRSHRDAAALPAAISPCRVQCHFVRIVEEHAFSAAATVRPSSARSSDRGTRRAANWRVLLPGALPVVIGKTAGVPGLHAERLWWVRAGVESAAGRGFEMAHKRVRVRDVGRLVRPSEADPDYLSYDRP